MAFSLGPFRLLVAILVGGAVFLGAMIVFGAVGIRQTFLIVPIPLFLAFMAIWPVVKPTMPTETFTKWLAYQLTVMVVLAAVIAGVDLYRTAAAVVK